MTAEKTTDITPTDEDAKIPPVVAILRQYQTNIEQSLPKTMTPARYKMLCENLLRQNPALLNVEPTTFLSAVLMSAQLGLEPGPPLGLSWIIPRRNKGIYEASFQIGYAGVRLLAYRSGMVKRIEAHVVHEGDDFDYAFQTPGGWRIDWNPSGVPTEEYTHVFCVAETVGGGELVEVMSRAEVIAHRDRYAQKDKKGKFGKAWRENEAAMGQKTTVIRVARQLPMSSEFQDAMVADGATPRELVPDLAGMMVLEADTEESNEDSDG